MGPTFHENDQTGQRTCGDGLGQVAFLERKRRRPFGFGPRKKIAGGLLGDFIGISDIESTKINQHWYIILGMASSRDYHTIIVEPCYIPIASETMEFAVPKFTISMDGNHQSIWVVYYCFTNVRHH